MSTGRSPEERHEREKEWLRELVQKMGFNITPQALCYLQTIDKALRETYGQRIRQEAMTRGRRSADVKLEDLEYVFPELRERRASVRSEAPRPNPRHAERVRLVAEFRERREEEMRAKARNPRASTSNRRQ